MVEGCRSHRKVLDLDSGLHSYTGVSLSELRLTSAMVTLERDNLLDYISHCIFKVSLAHHAVEFEFCFSPSSESLFGMIQIWQGWPLQVMIENMARSAHNEA